MKKIKNVLFGLNKNKQKREEWGEGPWTNEPDSMLWTNQKTGYFCALRRNMSGGFWCGYVLLDPDHPLVNCDINDPRLVSIDVHGGVTFVGCFDEDEKEENRLKDHIAIGFDCAHFRDLIPSSYDHNAALIHAYKDVYFAADQTNKLAEQLFELANHPVDA